MLLPAPPPPPDDSTSTATVTTAINLMVELLEAGRLVELIPHADSWAAAQRIFTLQGDFRRLVGMAWR